MEQTESYSKMAISVRGSFIAMNCAYCAGQAKTVHDGRPICGKQTVMLERCDAENRVLQCPDYDPKARKKTVIVD